MFATLTMCTDADAYNCTWIWGLYHNGGECALKIDSGRKSLAETGN